MSIVLLVPGAHDEEVRRACAALTIRPCHSTIDILVALRTLRVQALVLSGSLKDFDRETYSALATASIPILAFPEVAPAGFDVHTLTSADQIAEFVTSGEPSADSDHRGRLIVLWGPVGSPGRTTIAVNLAREIPHGSVLVIDADTYGPSIGQYLNILDDVSGVLAAARAANQGRLERLSEFAIAVSENQSVLTGIPRHDVWPSVRPAAWAEVLDFALKEFDFVLVDVGFCLEFDEAEGGLSQRNHMAVTALSKAELVLAIGGSDPVSLARLVRALDEVHQFCGDAEFEIVINAHHPQSGYSEREVMRTVKALTKRNPLSILPFDVAALQSLAKGTTLADTAPHSRLRQGLVALASHL